MRCWSGMICSRKKLLNDYVLFALEHHSKFLAPISILGTGGHLQSSHPPIILQIGMNKYSQITSRWLFTRLDRITTKHAVPCWCGRVVCLGGQVGGIIIYFLKFWVCFSNVLVFGRDVFKCFFSSFFLL